MVKEIGIIADNHTAICFKLAGLNTVFSVDNSTQAKEIFSKIIEKPNLRILLISEQILSKVQLTSKNFEQQFPLIIPIPTINDRKDPKVDFMADLIKRKTGIEVKL